MSGVGTELYRRTLAFDGGDQERNDLMRKVWTPTPWMIDAFTGTTGKRREREMLEWCYEHLGRQAFVIWGRGGRWQRGSATVNGWTWFGFSAEAELNEFMAAWPSPEGSAP